METGLEQKLQKFSGTVFRSAEEQRKKIEEEVESERKAQLNAKEDEYLADAYMTIQHGITKIRKEDNERVLHSEMEARKSLLLKREEIIDKVFSLAEEKICAYIKTEEYKTKLSQKITAALAELGEGSKIVYLTAADVDAFDPSCGAKLETVPDKEFIGGVKAVNTDREIAVNYSYYELLKAEKSGFLQKSGLSLS